MIDITRHIKISVLTVFVFAFCIVFHYPPIFFVTYAVMVLHETAHMAAAMCIGLKTDYIAFQPFGMNLRLKNKMVPSLADEVILYISGPLVNALAAALSAILYKHYGCNSFRLFYITNLSLFVINLLPAMPLDGCMIMKRIMTRLLGYRKASHISAFISAVICAALTALGIYAVILNKRNFSVILFALLLIGNLFTQREKYDAEYIGAVAAEYMAEGL